MSEETTGKAKRESGTRRRRGSLFLRVSLLSTTVSILTLVVFALAVIRHERSLLMVDLEERAQLLAASIDRVTAKAIVAEDWEPVVEQGLQMVGSSENVHYVSVTRKDGFSIVHARDGWRRTQKRDGKWVIPADEPEDVRPGDEPWQAVAFDPALWRPSGGFVSTGRVVTSAVDQSREVLHYSYPFTYSGVEWGWIHVGLELGGYQAAVVAFLKIIALLAIPAFALGLGVSFIFARRLTRPISQLRAFARRVASGNLDERVSVSTNGEVGALADAMNQMTGDLKKSQEKIQVSLRHEAKAREQEILIKEIHHRVKNNMQILSSLMRMQGRLADSDLLKGILKDGEARIRSMGLIHEKLYQSKSLSEIDFHSYIESLTKQLTQMLGSLGSRLQIKVDARGVELPLDTALPCGLIINELVSNAIKYAFPDCKGGTISISVKPTGDKLYQLDVADDGVGLPPENERRKGSLGMRLVDMLAEQLDGNVVIESSPGQGTHTRVAFSESHYESRV